MAQLETLYAQIQTRKKKWLIFNINIVAMTIIIVPIVLEVAVTKKKTHVIETSTTTTKILTSTIRTAPANITIATVYTFTIVKNIINFHIVTSFYATYNVNTTWKQDGITVAGGNGQGDRTDQLNNPLGFAIDRNFTLYIADVDNNRIVKWKLNATNGEIVIGGKNQENEIDQLSRPTDVVIDQIDDTLIICDSANNRLLKLRHPNTDNQPTITFSSSCYLLAIDIDGTIYITISSEHKIKRWRKGELDTTTIAGGNGFGDQLFQLYDARYTFVDKEYSLYVSDTFNHRIMKWMQGATKGIVAAGQGAKNNLTQLFYPMGLLVDDSNNIYVVDSIYMQVIRFSQTSGESSIIVGGYGAGSASYQLHDPQDILFDRQGNLYVVDCFNNRIQKFSIHN